MNGSNQIVISNKYIYICKVWAKTTKFSYLYIFNKEFEQKLLDPGEFIG